MQRGCIQNASGSPPFLQPSARISSIGDSSCSVLTMGRRQEKGRSLLKNQSSVAKSDKT